ncbi:BON domain-containing protein [Ahrensia sp. 13_GOM-1096m]|uniref:BON domain-containing protein n=1 Tax=Ahrensia sp. 13_GOM-1096m TaxID=1380380 RepID=UPI000479EF15|nr:BON domain-containing protein [Ahrensia sp. 13_GOM-1096m]
MVYKEPEFFGEPAGAAKGYEAKLEAQIAEALAVDGRVDAVDVEVLVTSGGHVILSGYLSQATEVQRCLEIASAVNGVENVQSHISIRVSNIVSE